MSHQESLVLTSSPLRRKSMMNFNTSNSSLPPNDDDAERMERRRNAEMEMRQSGSLSSPSDRRKSIGGGAIAGLSAAQLADHYANCIKLSAKNKINTKNAFSLQLIDYMAMMLKKRDSQMNNFQVASCTLDASTKIYGYRVDCVHTDVLKMAGGLAAGSRKKNASNEGEEGGSDCENNDDPDKVTTVRKKKNQKPKNVIASNIETLNEKIEHHAMDPFFLRSTGNMGDCQSGDCHFLGNLKMLKNCGLMLNSDMPYWDAGDDIASIEDIDVPLPHISIPSDKPICAVFSQFQFASWSLDDDEENDDLEQVIPGLSDADNDFAFDVNAVPEPVPVCDNDLSVDNLDEYGVDDDLDSDGEEVPAALACAATERTSAAKIVDLRKHLSSTHSEYSYFRAGALDLWAGPSHWKIRPLRSTGRLTLSDGTGVNAACKKQKPKQKKELTIEFNSEDMNMLMNSNTQSLKLRKRTTTKVWNSEKNTHPPDMHYDCKSLRQLYIRRLVGISIDPVPVEDNETSGYDYENDHDTSEYCPNVALAEDLDDADDGGGDGESEGFPQDIHNSLVLAGTTLTEAFIGDNLVAPPNKVARIFIPYAMRAKKMDMKKLKAAIWNIITNADGHKDVNAQKVEKPVDFSYVYSSLPSRLSSKLVENLSTSLAVVALLHLANENNLCIEGNENLSDLIISQG